MTDTLKWHWKMEYCRVRKLSPGETWAWNMAERAYNEEIHRNLISQNSKTIIYTSCNS